MYVCACVHVWCDIIQLPFSNFANVGESKEQQLKTSSLSDATSFAELQNIILLESTLQEIDFSLLYIYK